MSLHWRIFRKNFSPENSKNLTGPSLGELFEKISVSKIRKTSQVPPSEKFSKKFQSPKFEKPHRSLPWRNFRKNFSLENSKNLTGPSLGEIFEKISVSKIRKTSQVHPLEKFSKKFQSRKFEKPHRSLPWRNFRKNFSLENSKNLTGPSLGEIFEKISVSKIRKTSQVPPLGKLSKKFQPQKFEKPHRSLPWRIFRKDFSVENSKNLTGPSLGEIFEKISVSRIRKTSQFPP